MGPRLAALISARFASSSAKARYRGSRITLDDKGQTSPVRQAQYGAIGENRIRRTGMICAPRFQREAAEVQCGDHPSERDVSFGQLLVHLGRQSIRQVPVMRLRQNGIVAR